MRRRARRRAAGRRRQETSPPTVPSFLASHEFGKRMGVRDHMPLCDGNHSRSSNHPLLRKESRLPRALHLSARGRCIGLVLVGLVGLFVHFAAGKGRSSLESSRTLRNPSGLRFGDRMCLRLLSSSPKIASDGVLWKRFQLPSLFHHTVKPCNIASANTPASSDQIQHVETKKKRERVLENGVQFVTSPATECTMQINVTVPSKNVKATVDKLVRKMAKNVTVPGFRKTKKKTQIPQVHQQTNRTNDKVRNLGPHNWSNRNTHCRL